MGMTKVVQGAILLLMAFYIPFSAKIISCVILNQEILMSLKLKLIVTFITYIFFVVFSSSIFFESFAFLHFCDTYNVR